jgi:hypothetical protein
MFILLRPEILYSIWVIGFIHFLFWNNKQIDKKYEQKWQVIAAYITIFIISVLWFITWWMTLCSYLYLNSKIKYRDKLISIIGIMLALLTCCVVSYFIFLLYDGIKYE